MSRLAGVLWAGMLVLAFAPAACTRNGESPLLVSWRLADGRRCIDTGISRVEVQETTRGGAVPDGGLGPNFPCIDGETGTVVVSGVPLSGAHLFFRGLSSQQAVLYQGELSFNELPHQAMVVLYATGAQ